MSYGGLGYGVRHLRWGGGIIYFCEVVCVALGSYLNNKKLQTLQYKIYPNPPTLKCVPKMKKLPDPFIIIIGMMPTLYPYPN